LARVQVERSATCRVIVMKYWSHDGRCTGLLLSPVVSPTRPPFSTVASIFAAADCLALAKRLNFVVDLLRKMKIIPQRELRNRISGVLREVEAGERMRVTVDGRPVAELVPLTGVRRTFVPRDELLALLSRAALDRKFEGDLETLNATIDDL
jgi:prevent-host-death family protein